MHVELGIWHASVMSPHGSGSEHEAGLSDPVYSFVAFVHKSPCSFASPCRKLVPFISLIMLKSPRSDPEFFHVCSSQAR